MRVLSFGEVLWDIYPDKECLGGAPLNFAAHFVKQGGEAHMLSALGDDDLGQRTLDFLKKLNVKSDFVSLLCDRETGKCLVSLDENRIPTYNLVCESAYDYIDTSAVCGDFDVLYFGTLALRGEHNRLELSALLESSSFSDVFADVNLRKPFISRESISMCAENATVLKISDEELPEFSRVLFGEVLDCDSLIRAIVSAYKNIKIIIITKGGDGSYAYDCKAGKGFSSAAEKVTVVSTVGAGDSFSAAFLYKYLSGAGIAECLKTASKISAFVVSKTEAIPDYKAEEILL